MRLPLHANETVVERHPLPPEAGRERIDTLRPGWIQCVSRTCF